MSISVPANKVEDIDNRATALGFVNRSEYVRALLEADIDDETEQLPDDLLTEVKA